MRWGSASLLSSYDPEKEADRFIENALKDKNPSTVVLLGPVLDYLAESIRRRLSSCRSICLFYSRDVFEATPTRPEESWHVGGEVALDQFLRNTMNEFDMEGLEIIEWPASARLFPRESEFVMQTLTSFLREMRGNIVTTGVRGRAWIRNTIDNFLTIDRVAPIGSGICFDDRPIAIAASGPSLEAAASVLAKLSRRINLWALPSAVPFLVQNSVVPDLIVMTDPGYYSLSHLAALRSALPSDSPVSLAMPLSAARGAQKIADRIVLLEQPNFFERQFVQAAGLSIPRIAALGTVAASTLELALGCTKGDIIFLGLDLCYRDIQSHARPNLHETLIYQESNRLAPHYSRIFEDAALTAPRIEGGARLPLALRTYQEWFAGHSRSERIFRFLPFLEKPKNLRTIGSRNLERILDRYGQKPPASRFVSHLRYPPLEKRRHIATEILRQWRRILHEQKRALIEAQGKKGKWDLLFQNRDFLSLGYFICLFDLLSLKRQKRTSPDMEILEQANVMLDAQLEFIDHLSLRARHLNPRKDPKEHASTVATGNYGA